MVDIWDYGQGPPKERCDWDCDNCKLLQCIHGLVDDRDL